MEIQKSNEELRERSDDYPCALFVFGGDLLR